MPVDIPPSILAPILQYGLAGVVIIFVTLALLRKDKELREVQEARIADRDKLQEKHAAENRLATEAIETLIRAIREQHTASEQRWKVTENVVEIVRSTAEMVKETRSEATRIGRLVDANSIRLENLEKRFRE